MKEAQPYDHAYLETPLGTAEIVGDQSGVVSISVWDSKEKTSEKIPESLMDCIDQLREYFEGNRQEFNLKLNPQGTDFQKKVWKELLTIPFGKTTTYMKQTLALGNENAIRAVASANGKNPIWIIIPCHRVIGTDGSLTGYAGGLWRKKWLLEHENPSGQTSLF
jgi:methylated-DNA-[protein]-cysteine S-methyltransferase